MAELILKLEPDNVKNVPACDAAEIEYQGEAIAAGKSPVNDRWAVLMETSGGHHYLLADCHFRGGDFHATEWEPRSSNADRLEADENGIVELDISSTLI